MKCDHVFGSWIKGRRTGKWFRACQRCGEIERSDTPPEQAETKALKYDTPGESTEDFRANIRRRMARFNRFAMGAQIRRNMLDYRARQAGDE